MVHTIKYKRKKKLKFQHLNVLEMNDNNCIAQRTSVIQVFTSKGLNVAFHFSFFFPNEIGVFLLK